MKKLFYILFTVSLFVGCTSDSPASDNESLNGTTWESSGGEDGFIYKSTINFYESTYRIFGYEEIDGDRNESSSTGTYTYRHPNVVLIDDNDPQYPETLKISDNKLGVGNDIVWTKK